MLLTHNLWAELTYYSIKIIKNVLSYDKLGYVRLQYWEFKTS